MYFEAIMGLLIPAGCLGAVIASMIFYMIVKKSPKLQRKLANGTTSQRELLYGYLGMEKQSAAAKRHTSGKIKRRTAQLYDFESVRRMSHMSCVHLLRP